MKLYYGILTLAVATAIAGCNSANTSTARDSQGSTAAVADTNNTSISMQTLPDNPQVGGNSKTPMVGLSDGDRQFINTALASGQFEVSAASKAATHSNNEQVKALALGLAYDHSKADDQLQAIATRKGMTAPIGITTDQTSQLARLDQLNGAAFDSEFITQQMNAHADAIALFQTESTSGDAQDLRDWASATLPTLRNHMDTIKTLSQNNNLGMPQ